MRLHAHITRPGAVRGRRPARHAHLAGPPSAVGLRSGAPAGSRAGPPGRDPCSAITLRSPCGAATTSRWPWMWRPGVATPPRTVARMVAGQVLPSWNKTALDRTIRRALERADGSREVVAHSGVVPHPAWGTDSHFYFGWYHGDERDFPATMGRFPVLARFVSEFGAQAVPETDDFIQPGALAQPGLGNARSPPRPPASGVRAAGPSGRLPDLRRLAGGHPGVPGPACCATTSRPCGGSSTARRAASACSCWPTPSPPSAGRCSTTSGPPSRGTRR